MFFILSKLLWFLLAPLNLALILLTGAMLAMTLKHNLIARRLGIAAWVALIVLAVLPTGYIVTRYLETRYPIPGAIQKPVTGIIVLGGSILNEQGLDHGVPQLKATADRLTTFAQLGRQYPRARLVFTGGEGSFAQAEIKEAALVPRALSMLGFNPGKRLLVEDQSRTTWENALFSKELVQPKPGERWILVTSAFHMPRAMGVFRAVGWPVIPYPADYLTPGRQDFLGNMLLSHLAIKEMLGIASYRLTGKWSSE